MKVKIDTREKLHVITIHEAQMAANMTEEMDKVLMPLLDTNVKNVAINMKDIKYLDKAAAMRLLDLQNTFYSSQASLVLCEMREEVKQVMLENAISGTLSYTPTESEAIDFIQMEELEREFGEI